MRAGRPFGRPSFIFSFAYRGRSDDGYRYAQSSVRAPFSSNTANFADARYDDLFVRMKDAPNGPERLQMIREMKGILERERPWIELFHRENYTLFQGWVKNIKPTGLSLPVSRYVDVDPELRRRERAEWNRPVLWPAFAALALLTALVVPGIVTFLRERQ